MEGGRRGASVTISHELNEFAPSSREEFGRFRTEINLGHGHIEDRLRDCLVFGAEQSHRLGFVFGPKARLFSGVAFVSVVRTVSTI
jgi:hypothetical protein